MRWGINMREFLAVLFCVFVFVMNLTVAVLAGIGFMGSLSMYWPDAMLVWPKTMIGIGAVLTCVWLGFFGWIKKERI